MTDYIKPMLASPPKADRLEHLQGTHLADTKIDGIRAIAYWDGQHLTLVNRSMKDVTHRFPDLEASACLHFPDFPVILDGEIVAQSGSFQDTAVRDKQTQPADVAAAMKKHPVNFVAFDMLQYATLDLKPYPYVERRQHLETYQCLLEGSLWTITTISEDLVGYFEQVKQAGGEGIIAKRKRSSYRSGRFSDFIKFKTVRRLTCIGTGYEPGEGARAHFGAMTLALVSPDGVHPIGKVGTGFTAKEIDSLKADLDAGVMPLVEIEALNVTKDGVLRFPVYIGRRTDLSVPDARLDQLDDIPRC